MRRRQKLWVILLAAPLLLVAAEVVYWQVIESRLTAGWSDWLAAHNTAGWTANAATPARSGWPMTATLTVPEVSLKGGDPELPGGLTWTADRVVLRISLLRPGQLEVALEGMQRIRLGDGQDIPYTADRLRARMPLPPPGVPPRWIDLRARDLRAGIPAKADTAAALTIGSLRAHLEFRPAAPAGEPALAYSLTAEAINPPSNAARALGPQIASLTLDGALSGPLPRTRALADRAASWRDGGGSLQVEHFALNWGPLDLTGSATLALDDQLQPMGTGTARVVGYAETLDALAAHGALSHSAAIAAKAVLSLLAHTPDDGSPPDVEVPLTLQYRTLSMRQVPLVRLPEVDWP